MVVSVINILADSSSTATIYTFQQTSSVQRVDGSRLLTCQKPQTPSGAAPTAFFLFPPRRQEGRDSDQVARCSSRGDFLKLQLRRQTWQF